MRRRDVRAEPIYVFCKRPTCGGYRLARRPFEQRKGGFCSKKCAALVNKNINKTDRSAAGKKSGQTRQRRVLARIAGLTPLDAFRLGYKCGIQSKHRQIKRLVKEIRAARAAAAITNERRTGTHG